MGRGFRSYVKLTVSHGHLDVFCLHGKKALVQIPKKCGHHETMFYSIICTIMGIKTGPH